MWNNLGLKVEHNYRVEGKGQKKKKKSFIFNFLGELYKDFLITVLPWLLNWQIKLENILFWKGAQAPTLLVFIAEKYLSFAWLMAQEKPMHKFHNQV